MDEDSPPRRKKSRRDVELPKKTKKSSKQQQQEEAAEAKKNAAKKKKGGLSQLLGKRRCATEANERIARVVNQVNVFHNNLNIKNCAYPYFSGNI